MRRLEIHIHHPGLGDPLLRATLGALTRLEKKMSATSDAIDQLTAEVARVQGVEASALAVIAGIPKVVADAVAQALADNPGMDPSALNELTAKLEAATQPLADAVAANNPPAEPPFPPPFEG